MSAHTALPWRTESSDYPGHVVAPGSEHGSFVRVATFHPVEQADFNYRASRNAMAANAEFACRAVNCHDELLSALKAAEGLLNRLSSPDTRWERAPMPQIRAAIAKAEGRA